MQQLLVEKKLQELASMVQAAKANKALVNQKVGEISTQKASKLADLVGFCRYNLRLQKDIVLGREAFFAQFDAKSYYAIKNDANECLQIVRAMPIEAAEAKIAFVDSQLQAEIDQKHTLALLNQIDSHRNQMKAFMNLENWIESYQNLRAKLEGMYAPDSSLLNKALEFLKSQGVDVEQQQAA